MRAVDRLRARHRTSAAAAALAAVSLVAALAPVKAPAAGGKVVVAASATIKPKSAQIRVFCNGPQDCEGVLELVASASSRSGGKAKGSAADVLLGETSFELVAGASRVLRFPLTAAGRRLLGSGRPLKARARGSGLHPHAVKLKRVTT